jgi:ABC-type oligopeptide transport system substrate-binding subunit
MARRIMLALTLTALALALATAADSKTLRWANRGDTQTTDPHSQTRGSPTTSISCSMSSWSIATRSLT